jgi:hypothetical protein
LIYFVLVQQRGFIFFTKSPEIEGFGLSCLRAIFTILNRFIECVKLFLVDDVLVFIDRDRSQNFMGVNKLIDHMVLEFAFFVQDRVTLGAQMDFTVLAIEGRLLSSATLANNLAIFSLTVVTAMT